MNVYNEQQLVDYVLAGLRPTNKDVYPPLFNSTSKNVIKAKFSHIMRLSRIFLK